jgi:hypothetical protein
MNERSLPDVTAPIFLLGMPRSGTTWLSQIVESSPECVVRLSPNYSYRLKNSLSLTSTAADWTRTLRDACSSDDPFLTQNFRRESGELCFFDAEPECERRHLAVKDTRFHELYLSAMDVLPRAKIVYIARHPAAALWSWRSCKEFPPTAEFREQWRHGACRKVDGPGEYWGFDDWKALTFRYCALAAREPARYLIVEYEELVSACVAETKRIFAFLGVPYAPRTEAFITLSQSVHDERAYSVFKTKEVVDAWRADFPTAILREIRSELSGTMLERFAQ